MFFPTISEIVHGILVAKVKKINIFGSKSAYAHEKQQKTTFKKISK